MTDHHRPPSDQQPPASPPPASPPPAAAPVGESRREAPGGAQGADPADAARSTDSDGPAAGASGPTGAPEEGFSLVRAFGGVGGMVDAGLPGLAFVAAYAASGSNLRLALIIALSLGLVVAVVRLVRRDPLQNVVGGFVGVAIAAVIANATGKAEDFYLPGLFINAGYALAYLIANLCRWPLIGVLVGLASGWGMSWRQDPVLLRAFVRAGWLWVGFFALKLAVQLPLYLAGEVVALGIARVVMGWPLWLLLIWLTYLVVKGSVPRQHWAQVKQAAEKLAQSRGGS